MSVFGFAFLFSGVMCLLFLLQALFVRGRRKGHLMRSGLAFMFVVGSLVGFGVANDQEARDQGFLGGLDRTRANEAGYSDATVWAAVREEQDATRRSDDSSSAAAKPEAAEALEEIVANVVRITGDLPSHFADHGIMISEEARMRPLSDDVLAYARFYWAVDAIESNCQFLGQRTNIQILAPGNGLTSWITTAAMSQGHPNHADYLGTFERFETVTSKLGEATVCPMMYRLLGPNGSLMDDVLDINGLIDPEVLYRYEVRVKDGVLWSSKDYCERRYYLEQEPQHRLHELACNEAKIQNF